MHIQQETGRDICGVLINKRICCEHHAILMKQRATYSLVAQCFPLVEYYTISLPFGVAQMSPLNEKI